MRVYSCRHSVVEKKLLLISISTLLAIVAAIRFCLTRGTAGLLDTKPKSLRENDARYWKNQIHHEPAPGAFNISRTMPLIGGNHWIDGKLCAAIEKLIGDSSIGDFGAGLGQYGRCFMRSYDNLIRSDNNSYQIYEQSLLERMKEADLYGKPKILKSYEGFDGSPDIEYITNSWVKHVNLAEPFGLAKRFDWVLCLEVGQNIPAEYEDIFLDNLVRHAETGIILSWAAVGQTGHNHINNQSNENITAKLVEKGLVNVNESQAELRRNAVLAHFKNNLMVFKPK